MKRFMYAVKWCSFDKNGDSDYGTYPKAFNSRKAAHDWMISEGFERGKIHHSLLSMNIVNGAIQIFVSLG